MGEDELPPRAQQRLRARGRTGAFSSLGDFLPSLESTDPGVRATAAKEIASACSGGFFSAAAAHLDAATLEAVARSEEEEPGILWPFLGHFWRTNTLDVINVAAGKDARDWVFELLARSPASWVYEEFFSSSDDLVRLLRLGRDHDAHLAALEHGLDLEAARRAAVTRGSAPL